LAVVVGFAATLDMTLDMTLDISTIVGSLR
jgi:hypothetical protein